MKKLSYLFLILFFFLSGCNTKTGEELFTYYECINCHTFKGKGGKVGPDLTDVKKRKNYEWIRKQIRNPKRHNPNTIMKAQLPLITEKQIRALADYLTR